ncbi:MAG: hypothetical protein JOZ04_00185 [Acidimicrobiia bacterium]|nr:hypothetical protein [Acidimicrobiia bacterium]
MTRRVVVLALLAVMAAGCSQNGGGTTTAADRQAERAAARAARQEARCQRRGTCPSVPDTVLPPAAASPRTTAPSGPLKPVLQGLLDRDAQPPAPYVGTDVRGWVVKANWKDLQPSPGAPLAPNNAIDQAVAAVRAVNAAHPGLNMGLKLRVYAGIDAPDWAKSLDGGAVNVVDPQDSAPGTIGRFWTHDFGLAYADLQQKLAARYDNVAEVREVVVSRCTTFFAEPFLRDKGDRGSVANMLAAGFSFDADQTCEREEIDAHTVWAHTHSDVSFSPYQNIERKGVRSTDEGFTESMMDYCRTNLGARCVLENNAIRTPVQPGYAAMYERIRQLGPAISFQTATGNKIGDLVTTLMWAAQQEGANSVELPASYQQEPPQTFAAADAALLRNPT